MAKKIVLIDGHSILTRAFFGVPELTNSKGLHTNGVYGFLNIMFKVVEEENPEYLIVAFDVKEPTFRHKLYKEYKGTRKPMPRELHEQVPVIKDLLHAMNISTIEMAGYEADDLLGTLAKKGEREGYAVTIISGDKDMLQLASKGITIRIPKTKRGQTEVETYTEQDVLNTLQVTPLQFIDVKALMGDSSDNIPGVPGIGEKTATKIIVEYGSIENAFAHIDEMKVVKTTNLFRENYSLAQMSKTLATINTNVPLNYEIQEGVLGTFYTDKAYEIMKSLEFKSLLSRFEETPSNNECLKIEAGFSVLTSLEDVDHYFDQAYSSSFVGFHVFSQGISLSISNEQTAFIPYEGFQTKNYLLGKLTTLFDACEHIGTLNLKEQLHDLNLFHKENIYDLALAAYLMNPLKDTYHYDDIARDYLKLTFPSKEALLGKKVNTDSCQPDNALFIHYTCFIAYTAKNSIKSLLSELDESGQKELFLNIEMPLVYSLFRMEKNGIKVQKDALNKLSQELEGKISEIEKTIFKEVGESFNINSPKQLGEILFGKMNIPGGKKTKTGFSTSADVLEKLAPDFPVINKILEYRQLSKLKSTYADGLAVYIRDDGRIHGKFNQTITATGRISSTEPNLQNIPIRMEVGKTIRKVFVPEKDFVFLDADYSQIELRVLAHLSGDEHLIEAYRSAQDIHKITASKVFNTPLNEVTSLQRSNAKAVNFGIVYGISSFGLSQGLSISPKEAGEYIKQYFATYPVLKKFLDNTIETAKERGYVTTIFGRRRPVPELSSSNFMQRSFGERIAMNSPIQGSAADIMKIAMLSIDHELIKRGLQSRIVLQVHDEILIETHKTEIQEVKNIINEKMKTAADLKVNLEIEINQGENWYDAH